MRKASSKAGRWRAGTGWTVAGLSAWDARGTTLAAHFELTEGGFSVVVNDAEAIYPVEIDPVYSTPDTVYSGTRAGDGLGLSVSGAGDVNGDGYTDPAVAITACDPPEGTAAATEDDCDDTDATRFPGAEDVPNDGIDQDCDGQDATEASAGEDTGGQGKDEREGCGCASTAGAGWLWAGAVVLAARPRNANPPPP